MFVNIFIHYLIINIFNITIEINYNHYFDGNRIAKTL